MSLLDQCPIWLRAVLALLLGATAASSAATWIVTTNADSGPGSFRQAILDATNDFDVIRFNFTNAGPHRIQPLTGLPAITRPIIIDGYTQVGSSTNSLAIGNNANIQIELDGSMLTGNNTNGLRITTSNCTVRGLAIIGFPGDGIRIQGGPDNEITGCLIGLDATGTNAPGNGLNGIALFNAHGNTLGGSSPGHRNVIAGNQLDGLYLSGSSSNRILGNYSGTDASGLLSRGNLRGATLLSSSPGNWVGGPIAGAGNLLSGNRQRGLNIASSDNQIEGNIIGLNASGAASLSNGTHGVYLDGSSNRLGGLLAASANLIASNGSAGVTIGAFDATGNALLGNRIFGNGGLGIDLGDDLMPAENDPTDADEGANRGQNHPVLRGLTGSIQGALTSNPSTTFRLEFFLNPEADPSSFGEGHHFIGATNVTTGPDGIADFNWTPPEAPANGTFLTATATDPGGNTSEFSPAFAVTSLPPTNTILRINGQPAAGFVTVTNEALVTIDSPFAGGTIFYSLDDPDPARGTMYQGPFRLALSGTLRAVAFSANQQQSSEAAPVSLNVLFPPTLLRSPVAVAVIAGGTATFTAEAAGTAPLHFQWRRNGIDLPEATNALLTLENVQPAQAGDYSVVVTNLAGSAVSPAAKLSVNLAPAIGLQPASQNVALQGTATFCIDATGSAPLRYQWRHNNVNIPGETNVCLTITNVQLADGGAYAVVVANEAGALTSDPAELLVDLPPLLPGDNFANRVMITGLTNTFRGTNATFTSELDEPEHAGKPGGRSAWHTWHAPTNGIARFRTVGSGFDTLLAVYTGDQFANLSNVASDEDAGGFLTSEVRFRCLAESNYAVVVDAFAGLGGTYVLDWSVEPTAETLPRLLIQPASQTVTQGATVTLSVTADSPGYAYQWHFNGNSLTGATSEQLSLTNVQPAQVGAYSVGVTNAAGRGIRMRPVILEVGDPIGPVSEDKFEDAVRSSEGIHGDGFLPASHIPLYLVGAGNIGVHYLYNTNRTPTPGTNHCGVLMNADAWLHLKATNSGTMVVETTGSLIPTVMAVYVRIGPAISSQPIACGVSDPARPGDGVRATFTARAGTNYAILVDGLNRAVGQIQLHWALGSPPVAATVSPTNVVVHPGEPILLRAPSATGVPAPRYQWSRDGVPIPGADGPNLQIPPAAANYEGAYSVTIRNEIGSLEMAIGTFFLDLPLLTTTIFPFENRGVQGWTLVPATGALSQATNGGNPAGCLVAAPRAEATTWSWSIPSSSLGDLSCAYGGWLQFDLLEPGPLLVTNVPPLVEMQASGLILRFDAEPVTPPAVATNSGWKRHRVPFLAQGWPNRPELGRWHLGPIPSPAPSTLAFQQALSNVTTLRIRGRGAAFLSSRLDNVAILAARALNIGTTESQELLISWPDSLLPFQLITGEAFPPSASWHTNLCVTLQNLAKGLHQIKICGTNRTAFFQLTAPESALPP